LFLLVAQRSRAKEPVEMIAANPRPRHGTHPDKATDGFFQEQATLFSQIHRRIIHNIDDGVENPDGQITL
jgi:hypothetical protein